MIGSHGSWGCFQCFSHLSLLRKILLMIGLTFVGVSVVFMWESKVAFRTQSHGRERHELVVIAIAGGGKTQYEFFRVWQRVIADKVRAHGVKLIHVRFSDGKERVGIWEDSHGVVDIVYEGVDSYYPGVLNQTLMALQYVKDKYSFKHVIVSNLSTFWDFAKLLKYLNRKEFESSLPIYGGVLLPYPIEGLPRGSKMISGTGILLNRRSAEHVLNTPVDWKMMNDVFIKYALTINPVRLNIITWTQCWFDPFHDPGQLDLVKPTPKWPLPCRSDTFQYRIKTGDAILDLRLWNLLMQNVYSFGGAAPKI